MNGKYGWLIIAGVVVAWDLTASDSLSAAFKRGATAHPGLTAAACAVTTAHLYGKLPRRADPFHLLLDLIKR